MYSITKHQQSVLSDAFQTKTLIDRARPSLPAAGLERGISKVDALEMAARTVEELSEVGEQFKTFMDDLFMLTHERSFKSQSIDRPEWRKHSLYILPKDGVLRMQDSNILFDIAAADVLGTEELSRPLELGAPVRAELALKPADELNAELQQITTKALQTTGQHLSGIMSDLVGKMQVGVIEWLDQETCRYSHWTTRIEQEWDFYSDERTEGFFRRRSEQVDVCRLQYRIVKRLRICDVIGAETLPLNTKVIKEHVPAKLQSLLETTPETLKRFMRIVVGKEIYQEMQEGVVSSGSAVQERVVTRAPLAIPRSSGVMMSAWDSVADVISSMANLFLFDPALIIGPYVLAGWSSVVEKELEN